jgi:hypothetical protein
LQFQRESPALLENIPIESKTVPQSRSREGQTAERV